MTTSEIVLIDATAFCYRAFYALKELSTSYGQPTNAVYGFVNMLNKVLKDSAPEYIAVCFDISRKTFRSEKFVEYKIQRPPIPNSLASQIPLIKEIISAYNITISEKEGYEADDIIATLKKRARENGLSVRIVSSDKDLLQLVDENTVVFSPYKDQGIVYDKKAVIERFGVEPKRIIDIFALMGDASDNIPGVPGIGPKTARELIRGFGSLKALLKNIDSINPVKVRRAIKDNLNKIELNQQLCTLDDRVDIDFSLDKLKLKESDPKEMLKLFKRLEFKKFIKEFSLSEEEENIDSVRLNKKEINSLLKSEDELVLYGDSIDSLVFSINGKLFELDTDREKLKSILADPKIKKIGHDLKRLKVALAKDNINLEGLFFDVMVASYLVNPAKSNTSLSDTAWDYLEKVPHDSGMDNRKATDVISKLKPILDKELKNRALEGLYYNIEMPLLDVLACMELAGIKLDLEVLKGLSRDIERRLIKLIQEIYEISGCQFNINSPKQLREILFVRLKLPIVKKSKTGASTDEEVLRNLSSKHRLPALLLEYRQLTKLKSTYIDTLPNLVDPKTKRVHTCFNQTATETGRLSSTNPNLQNIPVKTDIGRQIRRAIISRGKNSYLLSCDYSQIELRVLAHLSKDKNLISAFKNDEDIHRATAALIYGVKMDDVDTAMRETAKRVNFGITYGLTSYGLSKDLGISIEEAQGFIDSYFTRFPGVKGYIQEQIQRVEKDGFVTTILGRRRYLPEINNKNQGVKQFAQRQAVNTPIQGSASDLIKLAMISIDKEIKLKELPAEMILQIHDELLFDVPISQLKGFVGLVREKMENVMKLVVPIRVDIKKGINWLEMEDV